MHNIAQKPHMFRCICYDRDRLGFFCEIQIIFAVNGPELTIYTVQCTLYTVTSAPIVIGSVLLRMFSLFWGQCG